MQLNNGNTSELIKLEDYKIRVEELLDALRRQNKFIEELKNANEQLQFELDDSCGCGCGRNTK